MVTTLDEVVTELFEDPRIHVDDDIRVIRREGRIVGCGIVRRLPWGNGLAPAHLDGFVDPDAQGNGLGTTLMAWQVAQASSLLADAPDGTQRLLRCDEYAWIEPAHHLYRRFGFETVRSFQEMAFELDGSSPPDPPTPPGVDLRPWDRDRERDMLEMRNLAFADHWGSTPITATDWTHWCEAPTTRLDLSWMALESDAVVGLLLSGHYPGDEAVLGTRDGWIDSLAVAPDRRGRGIASTLLAAAIRSFRGAGFSHAKLGVDSSSLTGAGRLYRRFGFATYAETLTSTRAIT